LLFFFLLLLSITKFGITINFLFSLIEFCNQNVDPLIPSVWGHALNEEDAFSTAKPNRRCIIM
jgi:hypothetical protein